MEDIVICMTMLSIYSNIFWCGQKNPNFSIGTSAPRRLRKLVVVFEKK